jgi:hypothetical protein
MIYHIGCTKEYIIDFEKLQKIPFFLQKEGDDKKTEYNNIIHDDMVHYVRW